MFCVRYMRNADTRLGISVFSCRGTWSAWKLMELGGKGMMMI